MKLTVLFFALVFPFFFTNSLIYAQNINDSLFVATVSNHITKRYLNQLESEASIFNGREYHPSGKLDENGHTLFINNQYVKGKIGYNGNIYEDVSIMYDLVHNQLVLLNYDKVGGIILMSNHVDSFSLNNHNFVNIKPDKIKEKQIEPGYYDLLYSGKVSLLAKRQKKIAETTNQYKVLRTVDEQNTYYLLKDERYFPLKGKKSLLLLLGDTKVQNQKYIKTKHLNFRKDKESAMIELVKFYDSILH